MVQQKQSRFVQDLIITSTLQSRHQSGKPLVHPLKEMHVNFPHSSYTVWPELNTHMWPNTFYPAVICTYCPDRWRPDAFFPTLPTCFDIYGEQWTCTPRYLWTPVFIKGLSFTVYIPLAFAPQNASIYLAGLNSICQYSVNMSLIYIMLY